MTLEIMNQQTGDGTAPAVRFEDVSVSRGDTNILDRLNWILPVGSSVAILGHNGSGKTTLTRVITGFMWPTSGTVEVLGCRLGATDMRELRRRISVVDPAARFGVDLDLAARDAVVTGFFGTLGLYDQPTDDQRQRADHLLRQVGLTHRRDHKLGLLSTGELRRCLLARGLVHLPELLILDEPTAGLDVAGREHVLATVDQLRLMHPKISIIMVTHHVEEISPRTESVLLLGGGRILAHGPPAKVLTPELLTGAFGCKVFVKKSSGRYWLEVLPEAWVDLLKAGREEGRP